MEPPAVSVRAGSSSDPGTDPRPHGSVAGQAAPSDSAGENGRPHVGPVPPPAPPAGWLALVERTAISRLLRAAGNPDVEIETCDGLRVRPEPGDRAAPPPTTPRFRIRLADRAALWKLVADPAFQFAELYADGRLHVSCDDGLVDLLVEIDRGIARRSGRTLSWRDRLAMTRRTTPAESRDDIHRHYDLGNDFYRLWLDEQLVYTCAYFESPDASLEQAQFAKMDHVCRKLRLRPGETVVEAGCGWGALALHMARRHGVRVRAYNISGEQLEHARRRAHDEGLADRVEFVDGDWRTIRDRADVFVSVGMLEHVGLANYPLLGETIDACLGPRGRGLIHSIGFDAPRPLNRWTRTRIFPGAQPPSLRQMLGLLEPHRFSVADVENLRPHYALTLRHWLRRFERNVDAVRRLFDERFVRAWRMYLAASVATFETGSMQLFQVAFHRSGTNDAPLTRAGLYAHLPPATCDAAAPSPARSLHEGNGHCPASIPTSAADPASAPPPSPAPSAE